MSEMVERAARAIDPQAWVEDAHRKAWARDMRRKRSLKMARAAIASLRVPTPEMVEIMADAYHSAPDDIAFEVTWTAAIDAALLDAPTVAERG